VPVPRFASWEDFNVWLEEQCRKRHADILRGHTETIGQRLQRDLEAMAELPPAPSDIVHAVPELIRGMSVTIGPAMPPLRLGVNIDHVATIRNARGGQYPDPVRGPPPHPPRRHCAVEGGNFKADQLNDSAPLVANI